MIPIATIASVLISVGFESPSDGLPAAPGTIDNIATLWNDRARLSSSLGRVEPMTLERDRFCHELSDPTPSDCASD